MSLLYNSYLQFHKGCDGYCWQDICKKIDALCNIFLSTVYHCLMLLSLNPPPPVTTVILMNLLGRPIIVDFSPVTDFREATCRQYEENVCNRGGYCNFMHLKKISRLALSIALLMLFNDFALAFILWLFLP